MTVLVLDPANLSLFYPKASEAFPKNIRLIAQVVSYDVTSAMLTVQRLPNVGQLHDEIVLDDVDLQISEPELLLVDLNFTSYKSSSQYVSTGDTVNIIGNYNGTNVRAIECYAVAGNLLLGEQINTLAEMTKLKRL